MKVHIVKFIFAFISIRELVKLHLDQITSFRSDQITCLHLAINMDKIVTGASFIIFYYFLKIDIHGGNSLLWGIYL